jgi:hypothetical protein
VGGIFVEICAVVISVGNGGGGERGTPIIVLVGAGGTATPLVGLLGSVGGIVLVGAPLGCAGIAEAVWVGACVGARTVLDVCTMAVAVAALAEFEIMPVTVSLAILADTAPLALASFTTLMACSRSFVCWAGSLS